MMTRFGSAPPRSCMAARSPALGRAWLEDLAGAEASIRATEGTEGAGSSCGFAGRLRSGSADGHGVDEPLAVCIQCQYPPGAPALSEDECQPLTHEVLVDPA